MAVKLCDLVEAAGPAALQSARLINGGMAPVSDVVIVDEATPPRPSQIVLAIGADLGSDAGRELLRQAEDAGASAVVFRARQDMPSSTELGTQGRTSILVADPHIGWAQLLLLLRTLTSAAQDETTSGDLDQPAPTSMHGLADAIAVMVGGPVVLYDRAHRVIAYSVQDHEIDEVRRDTILGKRTPEQWIKRFTLDRSAYQTFQNPDEVVRVDTYPNMRTRLRIAVHAGGEILGEVSVAEGKHPLNAEAEAALKRAATLAVPFMLRHRVAEDTERTARWQMLRGLLAGDANYDTYSRQAGLDPALGITVVGFAVGPGEQADAAAEEVFGERLVHLLSLQMNSIDPAAGVVADGAYYALVPTRTEAVHQRLPALLAPAMAQLQRLDIDAQAAVGRRVTKLEALPYSRTDVDNQLQILRRRGSSGAIATRQMLWAELVLLPAERAVADADPALGEHLDRLSAHDTRHGTEFVKTLRVYLDTFGSTSAAAEQLVLHPNTLRHRLTRLTDISGIDLEDPAQRFALALQLRAAEHPRQDST